MSHLIGLGTEKNVLELSSNNPSTIKIQLHQTQKLVAHSKFTEVQQTI